MKLKKPSELFEQKRLEELAKESVQDQKQLNSLNVIDKLPVFLPEPLILEPNQRPLR